MKISTKSLVLLATLSLVPATVVVGENEKLQSVGTGNPIPVSAHTSLSNLPNQQQGTSVPGTGTGQGYCIADNSAESTYIRVRRALVDPKEASDSYGRRLGRRFIVFEVTVENKNPALEYLLHDVSVDLSKLFGVDSGSLLYSFSSQDLIMLRGVPEKGADLDPRNLILHTMQETGAVAGGVTGLASAAIQDLYGGVTAAFNGPVVTAFGVIFPDHTATQLNRLSDSAFTANTVVAKQSAKTFAIFVPEGLFMTPKEQDRYWKDPFSYLISPVNNKPNAIELGKSMETGGNAANDNDMKVTSKPISHDYRQADICVDGVFISEVPSVTLTGVKYDDVSKAGAGNTVTVDLAGANFSASDTMVDLSITDSSGAVTVSKIAPSSVAADGKTANASIALPKDWTALTTITVGVESKGTGIVAPPLPLTVPLTLTSAALDAPANAGDGKSVVVDLTGQGIVPGDTQLIFNNDTQNPYPITATAGGTKYQATVTLPTPYSASTNYPCLLKSLKLGTTSQSVNLNTSN